MGAGDRATAPAKPATSTTRAASTAIPAPVTVPPTAYASPAANRLVIVDFVTKNVANLLNDSDTAAQTNARNNLTAATSTAGGRRRRRFCSSTRWRMNNAFSPKLAPKANSSLRQRLNMAIVTARVADAAQNVALSATTIQLINDSAEPVVLWGLKAAQPQCR